MNRSESAWRLASDSATWPAVLPAIADVPAQLEPGAQFVIHVEIYLEVVALPQDRQVERVEAAGDDEIVAPDESRPAHLSGSMVIVPGADAFPVDQGHQIPGEALEVIGDRIQVGHGLPHRLVAVPQVVVVTGKPGLWNGRRTGP